MFDKLKGNTPAPTPQAAAPTAAPSYDSTPTYSAPAVSGNLLAKDVTVQGGIKLVGDITIDGKVDGEIFTQGTVTFNPNAVIKATVRAGAIIVHSKVEGDLEATDRIELHQTAEMIGDIKAAVLKVDAGAVFVGNSKIGKAAASPEAKPAPKKKTPAPAAEAV